MPMVIVGGFGPTPPVDPARACPHCGRDATLNGDVLACCQRAADERRRRELAGAIAALESAGYTVSPRHGSEPAAR